MSLPWQHPIRSALACGALAIPAAGSLAAGFEITEKNASGIGTVFAGQAAVADDASTVHYNPAGLTRLGVRRQAVFAGYVIRPTSSFNDAGSCAPYAGTGVGTTACPFGVAGNLGHASGPAASRLEETSFVPNVYLAWELMPGKLWAGLGLNSPFGLVTEHDAGWIGRFHATRSEAKTISINPALAWRFGRASVGFGISAMRLSAELANAVSYRAVALASGVPELIAAVPPGAEGSATVEGHDWGAGWNAGLGVDVAEGLHLGVTYRSNVRFTLRGDARFDNRPAALGTVPQIADGGIEAAVELPDVVSLALAWQARPDVTLLADWTRAGWDSLQDLAVIRTDGVLAGQALTVTPFRFGNSWRAGLGVVWKLRGDDLKLRFGVAYETSPVADAFRTPRLPDSDRRWLGAGVGWRLPGAWGFDLGLAWVRPKQATSSLPNQETATSPPKGSLVGSYSSKAFIVGAQANWSF